MPRIGVPLLYFMLNGQGTAKAAGESTSSGRRWSNWRGFSPQKLRAASLGQKKQEKDMVGGMGFLPAHGFLGRSRKSQLFELISDVGHREMWFPGGEHHAGNHLRYGHDHQHAAEPRHRGCLRPGKAFPGLNLGDTRSWFPLKSLCPPLQKATSPVQSSDLHQEILCLALALLGRGGPYILQVARRVGLAVQLPQHFQLRPLRPRPGGPGPAPKSAGKRRVRWNPLSIPPLSRAAATVF